MRRLRGESLPIFITVLALCLLSLPACTATFLDGSRNSVNLAETSYGAADMLVQQSKSVVSNDTPLKIGVLSDMNNPGQVTAFGRIVAGQIGARFVQLGYNVTSSGFDEMVTVQEEPVGMVPVYEEAQASGLEQSMITGQYAVAKKRVLVNLRIVDAVTGRVMAAYDYSVPLNSDIKALTKTKSD